MNPLLRILMQSLHFPSEPLARAALNSQPVRRFGATSVRMMPTRYDDPHAVARKVLLEKKLDRRGFATWQDLINHFARNGDVASVYASFHFAKSDKEDVKIPHISDHLMYIQNVYKIDDFKIPLDTDVHYSKLHQAATWCVRNFKLDHEFFKTPDELADYWIDLDNSTYAQRAYSIKHMEKEKKT